MQLIFSCFRFKSNLVESGYGFQLEYEQTNEAPTMSNRSGLCGTSVSTPIGILTSPSFPENYPNNKDCIYTISQPKGNRIILNIVSMDIEFDTYYKDYYGFFDYDYFYHTIYEDYQHHQYGGLTCNDDYLEIRDGASEKSPLIDGYCGSSANLSFPILIEPTQNNVWMR